MKTPNKRHRISPEAEFASLIQMVKTLNEDHEAKVLAASSDRSRCGAVKRWKAALTRYEVKLARFDEPAFNKKRFKIITASLDQIHQLSSRREKIQTRTFCAFCLSGERCVPLRQRKTLAEAA